jgi:hypothetical protein
MSARTPGPRVPADDDANVVILDNEAVQMEPCLIQHRGREHMVIGVSDFLTGVEEVDGGARCISIILLTPPPPCEVHSEGMGMAYCVSASDARVVAATLIRLAEELEAGAAAQADALLRKVSGR